MKTVIVLIVLNLLFIAKFAGESPDVEPNRRIARIVMKAQI